MAALRAAILELLCINTERAARHEDLATSSHYSVSCVSLYDWATDNSIKHTTKRWNKLAYQLARRPDGLDARVGQSSCSGRCKVSLLEPSGATHLPIQCIQGALSTRLKQPQRIADSFALTMPRWSRGSLNPLPTRLHGVLLNYSSTGTIMLTGKAVYGCVSNFVIIENLSAELW
jgi:hypothetical protein